jgi:hypothetical protein
VGENPPDDDGIIDGGNHTHAAATSSTRQHVHSERVLHQLRPRPLSRRRRSGLLHAHVAAWVTTRRRQSRRWPAVASSDHQPGVALRCAARLRRAGGPRRAWRDGRSGQAARDRCVGTDGVAGVPPVGDRPGAPPTVRRQYPVVEDEVDPRARRQRGEAFEQFDRFEDLAARLPNVPGPRCVLQHPRLPPNILLGSGHRLPPLGATTGVQRGR